ncbi:MAG TPA: hypothetical protein IAC25_02310 [Candidatus Enterenecus stercoripullorum]|nr:hypothetical protein [Candidatus Enterenecus stercoripullorum]
MNGEVMGTGGEAQQSVIGSMLIDDRCVPVVLAKIRAEDFTDGTCRATFRAIQKLILSGRPVDPVTVVDEMAGKEGYVQWLRQVMELTPTAANVETYIDITKRSAQLYQLRSLADQMLATFDLDSAAALVRKMSGLLSSASRMPRMTGVELAADFLDRMKRTDKPEYIPWGIPSADRMAYAELGDMILLGGYASAGKTLLSILMALGQAKRYRVGYYTLETKPEKMADRIFAHLAKVPLDKIKTRDFGDGEWARIAQAASDYAVHCPFDIIRAAGSSVDDIAADAVGHGYQIVYVDYLQLIEAPGIRPGDRYATVTAVSRGLKLFAQSTGTAVVALAQLSRPDKVGKDKKPVPPSMASFRESGQIEQDADMAFLLWSAEQENNQARRVLKLAKNKEGRKFRVELDFDGATQTMTEVESEGRQVAAKFSANGRAIQQRNRAKAKQMTFEELSAGEGDNPFENERDQ